MKIQQLEYYVRICEHRSISKVAAEFNIAQPALGLQIRALEEELGAHLLRRDRRGTFPTETGLLFLAEAQILLDRWERTKAAVRASARGESRTVRLGITRSLASSAVEPLIDGMAKHGIRLQIFEEFSHVLVDRVKNDQLDLALAFNVSSTAGVETFDALREPLYLIGSPRSAFGRQGPITLAELCGAPLAMPSARDRMRQLMQERAVAVGLTLDVRYEIESVAAIKDLVVHGKANGVLSRNSVQRELDAGVLVARPITEPEIFRVMSIVTRSDPASPEADRTLVASFARELRRIAAEQPRFDLHEIQPLA